jgi:hypothetical protein
VASIRNDLAAGRSAIVQVVSTNEAVMERRLAEIPPEEWNNLAVDLTPKDQVLSRDQDNTCSLQPLFMSSAPRESAVLQAEGMVFTPDN